MADLSSTLKPDKITALADEFKTTVLDFENGDDQRFAHWHAAKVRYRLIWKMMSSANLASLRAFFTSKQGRWKSWTINDSRLGVSDVTVFFDSDRLDVTPMKFMQFNVEVDIITA